MCSTLSVLMSVAHLPLQAAPLEPSQGIAPYATATYTYDSNLLNRSEEGSGPAPESDQIERIEVGSHINFQLSRQKFSGAFSFSDTRHDRFTERNADGHAHRLRWNAEIGETVAASIEGGMSSDQAPIQTGLVSAVQREQDYANASLSWRFHPNYSVVSYLSKTNTQFTGSENSDEAALSGLNRNDEEGYVGIAYHPGSGSTISLLFKQADGHFPIRQTVAPGQSISNDFHQNETELLGQWNWSEITAFSLSLSSVQRDHEEIPQRDFSGTNYRLEVFYRPTVKTNFNLTWGKQIVGISDATNSDALARQLFLGMNMEVTDKVLFKLAYRPQNLQFDGTDGFSTAPRTERVKEGIASLEYQLHERMSLGANFRNRDRATTIENADYTANSMSVFLKYVH